MSNLQLFEQTSNEPYDRHHYKIKLSGGRDMVFECYEEVQYYWFTHKDIPDYLQIVEVLDKSKPKQKVKSKGFSQ